MTRCRKTDMKSFKQFLEIVGITHPIIQAPMAGNTTPEVCASVYESGGLASLPFGPFLNDQNKIHQEILRFKTLTNSNIVNLNFFCHQIDNSINKNKINNWQKLYNSNIEELKNGGISFLEFEQYPEFGAFLDKILRFKPKVVSFHFGTPSDKVLVTLKDNNILTLATATSIAEVEELMSKVDGIVLQGYEAGGHRGHYLGGYDEKLSVSALFKQVKRLDPDCFIIPAGGLVDKADIDYYIDQGASACQIGTAFVAVAESNGVANSDYLNNTNEPTVMTDLISGRNARCIKTEFINEVIDNSTKISRELPPFGWLYYGYKQWMTSQGPEKKFYLVGANYKLVKHGLTTKQVMKNLIGN